MKKRNFMFAGLTSGLCAAIAITLLVVVSGCEIGSAGKVDVQVAPANAEIRRGESIALTATGWEDFRWSLSNNDIGRLSATVGASVVYTATQGGGSGVDGQGQEQIVTARAITQSQLLSTSTNTVDGLSATSRIRHL